MEKQKFNSIQKTIHILEILGTKPYEFTCQSIAELTGFNITTVYRILHQLEESDFVAFDPESRKYRIGVNAYHIGAVYVNRNQAMSEIQQILYEISEIAKESVGMAVHDKDKIVSIIEIEVCQPMKMNDITGRYFPVNKGNYGKVITAYRGEAFINEYLDTHSFEKTFPRTLTTKEELLAEYAKIRENGYGTSIDELGIDIIGVGIPIFDKKGGIFGCVAVAFFRDEGWEQKMKDLIDLLQSRKKDIELLVP